jgi:hypothetical protein
MFCVPLVVAVTVMVMVAVFHFSAKRHAVGALAQVISNVFATSTADAEV